MMEPDHKIPWEQRFDRKFPRFQNRAFTEDTVVVIKSFISNLLEEVIDDVDLILPDIPPYQDSLKQLKDKYGIK